MVVISGIMGEKELLRMTEPIFDNFKKLLNKFIVEDLQHYRTLEGADPEAVKHLNDNMGDLLDSIELNKEIQDMDILQTILNIGSYQLGDYINDKDLYNKLEHVEELLTRCTPVLPVRQIADFRQFDSQYKELLAKMGTDTTYPNMLKVYDANKQILYSRNEKATTYISNTILLYRSTWYGFKRGLDYNEYCDQHNIRGGARYAL